MIPDLNPKQLKSLYFFDLFRIPRSIDHLWVASSHGSARARHEMVLCSCQDVLGALEACWLSHAGAAEDSRGDGSAIGEAAFVLETLQALSLAGGRDDWGGCLCP